MIVNIPGPKGSTGAAGTNGTDGIDAYTTTTAQFLMPAELANVVVAVVEASWAAIGQKVFAGVLGGAARGTFEVVAVNVGTLTLKNMADTANDAYLDNSAVGTAFAIGTKLSPSGLQGPAGADGSSGAPDDATYITQTADGDLSNEYPLAILNTGLLKVTNGVGADGSVPMGIAASNVPLVDSGAALTAGEAVFAKAGGLESKTAANARTALSLGTIATQAASAVAITGGTIAGTAISTSSVSATTLATSGAATLAGLVAMTNLVATTPSALQTLAAANLIAVAAAKVRVVGNGGPVVMTSTPTIALGTLDGQELLVQGTHDTNTVELQDNGSLAGSKLRLGAASRVLGDGDTIRFTWDTTLGMWLETSFTALV